MRARPVDFFVLTVDGREPPKLARLGRVRVRRVKPRRPVSNDPHTLCGGRRVASCHHSTAAPLSIAVPANDVSVLAFRELGDFIEALQPMWSALVLLLVRLVRNAPEFDLAPR